MVGEVGDAELTTKSGCSLQLYQFPATIQDAQPAYSNLLGLLTTIDPVPTRKLFSSRNVWPESKLDWCLASVMPRVKSCR
jgi:hypothetical protein